MEESLKSGEHLSVHYLSSESQNEFLSSCVYYKWFIILFLKSKSLLNISQLLWIHCTKSKQHWYVSSPTYQEGYKTQEHFIELTDFTNKIGVEIEELTFIFLVLKHIYLWLIHFLSFLLVLVRVSIYVVFKLLSVANRFKPFWCYS